jgi:predicted RNase H-like HicB family nuclease
MFIATYTEYHGCGETLEEAFENLSDNTGGDSMSEKDNIEYFEGTPIEVEYKIIKKDVVSKITKCKD